jgi:hypothetical protein
MVFVVMVATVYSVAVPATVSSMNASPKQWDKTFGGQGNDESYSVQLTSDGGYIIAGYITSLDAGLADVYLIKTDVDGNIQWTRTYGGEDNDWGCSVLQTSDGGNECRR